MTLPTNNNIVVTALGTNTISIVAKFTNCLKNCGVNIVNTKMLRVGREFAILALLEGSWNAIAKIEAILPNIEKELGLNTHIKRTNTQADANPQSMLYVVHAVSIDRSGIISDLALFFSQHNIPIEDITAHTYINSNLTCMLSLTININISVDVHIPSLREKFMTYCDKLNLDAGIEPLRD